jgi:CRP-like cAMP-binding protein
MMHADSVVLTRSVRKGTRIFSEREKARTAYVVLSGRVALSSDLRPGVRIYPCFDGAVLGLPETLAGTNYQMSATARTNVTVHVISREDVLDMLKHPEEGFAIVTELADKVTELYREIKIHRPNGRHRPGPSRSSARSS